MEECKHATPIKNATGTITKCSCGKREYVKEEVYCSSCSLWEEYTSFTLDATYKPIFYTCAMCKKGCPAPLREVRFWR